MTQLSNPSALWLVSVTEAGVVEGRGSGVTGLACTTVTAVVGGSGEAKLLTCPKGTATGCCGGTVEDAKIMVLVNCRDIEGVVVCGTGVLISDCEVMNEVCWGGY